MPTYSFDTEKLKWKVAAPEMRGTSVPPITDEVEVFEAEVPKGWLFLIVAPDREPYAALAVGTAPPLTLPVALAEHLLTLARKALPVLH